MAQPTSRQTLIDFCLRRLGEPVLEVNVDEDQIEDKVDDALQMYQEFHSDATFKTYLKHQVTQTDIDNEYIPVPSNVIYVTKLFPINPLFQDIDMFDIRYQYMLNSIADFTGFSGGISYYYQMEQYLEFIDMLLSGSPLTTWSRHQDRLYIWGDFNGGTVNNIEVGDYVVAEVFTVVDPDSFTSVYNDMFVKNYTTSLIKQQWGMNMLKFEGIQLPGGVTVNGRQLYDDATQELQTLEEKLRLEQELPPDFFMG